VGDLDVGLSYMDGTEQVVAATAADTLDQEQIVHVADRTAAAISRSSMTPRVRKPMTSRFRQVTDAVAIGAWLHVAP